VFDSYDLTNSTSHFNQISNTRQRQYTEKEALIQKIKDDAAKAALAGATAPHCC
jgi:hypothetical protein